MIDFRPPILRPVVWLGNSKRNVQAFPDEAKKLIGDELRLIQCGEKPASTKFFKGVGRGVLEIAIRHDKEAYRTVLAVQLGSKIYILHAFQKKSKSGTKTPKRDVDLIKQRYREAQELAKNE